MINLNKWEASFTAACDFCGQKQVDVQSPLMKKSKLHFGQSSCNFSPFAEVVAVSLCMPAAAAKCLFFPDKHSDVKEESRDIFCVTAKVLNAHFSKFTILKHSDYFWHQKVKG